MNKTRIMLVDDHGVLRAGLKALFDAQPDMEVVAESASASAAWTLAEQNHPDVLVLDMTLPGGGSLQLAEKLVGMDCGTRILVLTMHDDPAYVRAALAAGATGYVVKTVSEQQLLEAVRAVRHGQVVVNLDDQAKTAAVFASSYASGHRSSAPVPQLSERELEVLILLGQGHTNQSVADQLDISPKTVATYRARIGEKLGLRTTPEFVKYVTDTGLVEKPKHT